jgi:hypothetical protein
MRVTSDKYELPLAVADSVIELSEMMNIDRRSLESIFSKIRKRKYGSSIYKIVEVVDDDINEYNSEFNNDI